jgi:hypothetical protein
MAIAIFCPKDSRMLRGPVRRAGALYGGRCGALARYFDVTTGICQVQAENLNGSVFNAIQASAWYWESYDKVCKAFNTVPVSGGGLVASGLGPGTEVVPIPNTAPIVCTAYLVDTTVLVSGG